ncbi:putative low-complexity protein [Xenococcus sp. PCC 7305]|uniref:pentapeptide repeat-containing protein n=1 Tax=Xenococcus sp. PCC 7305 TaxID=102125 RepID=UPI0002AC1D67|nr:pentapeptide repeat-containing protein [Xenococcus sp. PCC 7305]ELS05009.1 putative low-complexity protein [Xenococcus sp. PCC 7305]
MVKCLSGQEDLTPSQNSSSNSNYKQPLGEILLEAGLVSMCQIEIALETQKKSDLKIGEILAANGFIKQEIANFFADRWLNLIQKQERRPLAFYLYAAGLLDKKQLSVLKQKQKHKKINSETRLHFLAIEQGYVKQVTVNFFLKHLFDISDTQNLSFTKPYELIKNYINGETNFQGLELNQIPLNGVKLKKVILDNSNLKKVNLNNSNLSSSSLVGANLTFADLELANLSQVNFTNACLIEANLRESNLEQANFETANLQEADLRGANLLNASFASADLRGSKLTPNYSYEVYYDKKTIFDTNFNPIKAGWKLRTDIIPTPPSKR